MNDKERVVHICKKRPLSIPFLKHIFVNDIPVLPSAAAPVSASTWLKEFTTLSFLLALFFCVVSFENTNQRDQSQ